MSRRLALATLIALALLGLAWLAPATAQPAPERLFLPDVANNWAENTEEISFIEIIPAEDSNDIGGEYVALFKNVDEPIDIGGWRVINASREDRPAYIFPSYVVDDDNLVYLYTDEGERDPTVGDFYWGLDEPVWRVGDVAELRDSFNRLIHSYMVVGPNGPPPTTTTDPLPQPSPTGTPPSAPQPTGTSTAQPPTPTRDPAVCAAEYPTVCVPPPPPDLDCGDIVYRFFPVLPPDRHRFDSDSDGVGCESE